MSNLKRAIRRATVNLTTVPASVSANVRAMLGRVASVTAGAAADGHDQVTVTVGGDTVAAPYLSSYSPAVGDTVLVLFLDGSPVIAGRIDGRPTY